jgi:hypothetical protein
VSIYLNGEIVGFRNRFCPRNRKDVEDCNLWMPGYDRETDSWGECVADIAARHKCPFNMPIFDGLLITADTVEMP